MSEDFKTYAQLHAELATLKAERDELREALNRIARINSHEDYSFDQRETMIAEEARAALAKGTDKKSWPWAPRRGEGQ